MIHTAQPFGAEVQFRDTPAQHYELGRVFGVSVKDGQEFYDIEDSQGRRFYGLTDVKENDNGTSD